MDTGSFRQLPRHVLLAKTLKVTIANLLEALMLSPPAHGGSVPIVVRALAAKRGLNLVGNPRPGYFAPVTAAKVIK